MKALFDFIIEPVGERYNNKKGVEDSELILNTELHNHNYSNRIAKVIAVPSEIETEIEVGDKVIVHHNVFRRFKDIRGVEKNSKSYYKDNIYFAGEDQVYAYKRCCGWTACKGFNFVKPIKETKMFSINFEKEGIGVLYAKDPELKELSKGDLVGFKPGAEYEFVIGKDRVYRVPTNSITIKYEYQGNEAEYNPSWT
jgi:hypothetical protein